MQRKDTVKVTFYADPETKKLLDRLEPGVKSHKINEILREHLKKGARTADQLQVLEMRLKKAEADLQYDGFAIAAVRRFLLNHSGGKAAKELSKEFYDIYYGSGGIPPRHIGGQDE